MAKGKTIEAKFESQSRLIQIILLLIPFVNWVTEVLVRWSTWSKKGGLLRLVMCLIATFGGGIILDGQVYSGFNFAGAELGHMVIVKDGRACSCGRKGCWETYSSATGLIRTTREKIEACRAEGRATIMEEMIGGDLEKVSGRTAFNAMRQGDAAGAEVVGAGIVIEKAYQPGGELVRSKGVRVESLARVAEMKDDGSIVFCD